MGGKKKGAPVIAEDRTRQRGRTRLPGLELATVYRDRLHLSYDQMLKKLEELASIYTIFSVVAAVQDVSQEGLGLKFEGQQMMARNMLTPDEHYIIKLTLALPEIPSGLGLYLGQEGNYHYLLIRAACRWQQVTSGISTAGFELLPENPSPVVNFLREHFFLGDES